MLKAISSTNQEDKSTKKRHLPLNLIKSVVRDQGRICFGGFLLNKRKNPVQEIRVLGVSCRTSRRILFRESWFRGFLENKPKNPVHS